MGGVPLAWNARMSSRGRAGSGPHVFRRTSSTASASSSVPSVWISTCAFTPVARATSQAEDTNKECRGGWGREFRLRACRKEAELGMRVAEPPHVEDAHQGPDAHDARVQRPLEGDPEPGRGGG